MMLLIDFIQLFFSEVTSLSAGSSLLSTVVPDRAHLITFNEVFHNFGICPGADPLALSVGFALSIFVHHTLSVILGEMTDWVGTLATSNFLVDRFQLLSSEVSSLSAGSSLLGALLPNRTDLIVLNKVLDDLGISPFTNPLALSVKSISILVPNTLSVVLSENIQDLSMHWVGILISR
jgi:hypothetical protein